MSSIEWTDATWNPTVGCSRVSAGCEHCYAERVAARGLRREHQGLTTIGKKGPRWTGEVRFLAERLVTPLRWRAPRRVFVDSMSDLFHEGVEDAWIDQVFATMAATPRHTYQILTKRPERMRAYAKRVAASKPHDPINSRVFDLANALDGGFATWPLPNVWLGVSVEDQETADDRIPELLGTRAAVRFVSYEPALAGVDFTRFVNPRETGGAPSELAERTLDLVIVGGESGPGARPLHVAWVRATIDACARAGVACFVKQLGAHVITRNDDNFTIEEDPADPDFPGWPLHLQAEDWIDLVDARDAYQGAPVRVRLRARKGNDPSEWRSDLRVRELPTRGIV